MRRKLYLMAAAIVAVGLTGLPAGAADLHRLWDTECASCHDHAGAFARQQLSLKDGILTGSRPGRDLETFLARHTRLRPDEIAAVLAMLKTQAAQPDLFRQQCSICHRSAAELARGLTLRDDRLYGRYSNRPIDQFLISHGRLTPEEITQFLAILRRVEGEVHRPGPQ